MKECIIEKILDTNLNNLYIISNIATIKKIVCFCVYTLFFLHANAQIIEKRSYDKAKRTIADRINKNEQVDFNDIGYVFEHYAIQNPGNAEAWYFLGYAIDKFNSFDGESIINSSLSLATKASECFQNSLELSNGKYSGDRLLLDPHTKILSIWGGQAFKYLYQNKPDSASWCLQEARRRGGIDPTVLRFYSQLLDDVNDSAYLFNSGDMQVYYIAYLQQVLNARNDIRAINTDYLNTSWYPQLMKNIGKLRLYISDEELRSIKQIVWTAKDVRIQNMRYPNGDSLLIWNLPPTFDNTLLRSDQIMLRLLQQNAMQEDVYFPSGLPQNLRLYLTTVNYLQLRGLTVKLNDEKETNDVEYLRKRLPALSPINSSELSFANNPDNLQPLNVLRFLHAWTAEYALKVGDTTLAKYCFKLAEEKYPEQYLPFYDDNDKKWFRTLEAKVENL